MFPQNSRLLNLFRLKNDTKFNLEMLQFYYSHETPNRETSEKSTKLKRFSRRFLFLIITVEMVRRFSVCIFL